MVEVSSFFMFFISSKDIIDVEEDNDIIDEEDPIPYDLADSDDEDLVNLDINDGVNMLHEVTAMTMVVMIIPYIPDTHRLRGLLSPRRQETIEVILLRLGGYIPGSGEGRLKLLGLMNTCTTLSNRVTTLENELLSINDVYHKAFITLTKRVKKEVQEIGQPLKNDDDATLAETFLNIKRSTAKDKGKVLRYHALQNRPFTKVEVRKNMCMYLKNQGGYKQSYFKGMKDLDFIFNKKSLKKQKLYQQIKVEEEEVDSDQEVEEMKLYMRIVLDGEIAIDAIPLATKPQ
uniref:Uncharacterized protein n=1 Tax=Tanacetum cinerariifolium TaxID=118510 RepID=A0A6L2JZV7_TANCI|nr:hypothetical protein [Tanacetum cinerariifolium]